MGGHTVSPSFVVFNYQNTMTMFTIEQIKAAHSKVRSGADFPAYIQEMKTLGVIQYETFVMDGHTDYSGANGYTVSTEPRYEEKLVAETVDGAAFKAGLKAHQEGNTDYTTFIHHSASCGIEKWVVNTNRMTCTYFDKAGNEILVELIPQV
jgi:uncharacterized protein YbcV (DUF1398 family)